MKKYGVYAAVVGALCLTDTAAQAAHHDNDRGHFGFVVGGDLEWGGDDIAKLYFTNGDTEYVKAGQGITIEAGGHYLFPSEHFDITATVGYKYVTTRAKNADISVGRVVYKLFGSVIADNGVWFGAGPVWHTDTKFKGDGYVPDVTFDDALGFTVGAGWRWVGITYTNIEYKSPFTGKLDASSVGITGAYKF
jgi:hypothetical protein